MRQRSGTRDSPGSGGARRLGVGLLLALALMLACAAGAAASPGRVDYPSVTSEPWTSPTTSPASIPKRRPWRWRWGRRTKRSSSAQGRRPAQAAPSALTCSSPGTSANGTLDPAFGSRAGVLMRVEAPSTPGSQARAAGGARRRQGRQGDDRGRDRRRHSGRPAEPGRRSRNVLRRHRQGRDGSQRSRNRYRRRSGKGRKRPGHGRRRQGRWRRPPAGPIHGDGPARPRLRPHGVAAAQLGPGENLPAAVAVRKGKAFLGAPVCCSAAGRPMRVGVFAEDGTRSRLIEVGLPKRLKAGRARGISTVIPAADGATLVVGSAEKGTFVARLLPSGKPDPTFGDRGYALVPRFFVEGPDGGGARPSRQDRPLGLALRHARHRRPPGEDRQGLQAAARRAP